MTTIIRAISTIILSFFLCSIQYAGEVRFLHLSAFEGQMAHAVFSNLTDSHELTCTVTGSAALYEIPAGQWDISLYLPGAVPLRHKRVAVPASPQSIGVPSFINAHLSGSVSGVLYEGTYIADSSIHVVIGASLTVHEGVTIMFMKDAGCLVSGRLEIRGKPSNRVKLCGYMGEYWQGLTFSNSTSINDIAHAEIKHTISSAILSQNSQLQIDSSDISANMDNDTARGILSFDNSNITISNTAFSGTDTRTSPSVLFAQGGKLSMVSCLVVGYSLANHPLIHVNNSTISISNTVIYGNSGGAVLLVENCASQSVSIINSIFSENTAESLPAGVWLADAPSTLRVTDNVFFANESAASSLWSDNYLFHNATLGVLLPQSDIAVDAYGNIWQDPLFNAPQSGDFTLNIESPILKLTQAITVGRVDANEPNDSKADSINELTNYIGLRPYALIKAIDYLTMPIDIPYWTGDIILQVADASIVADGKTVVGDYYQIIGNEQLHSNTVPVPIVQAPPVKLPIVDAGPDAHICSGDSHILDQTSALHYTLLRWSTDGDGTFSDNSILHPTYVPGSNDVGKGAAILTLYAENGSPSHYELNRIVLSIQAQMPLFAQHELRVCSSTAITLDALYGNSFLWDNGSTSRSISVLPSKKQTYSLTATIGACIAKDSVSVVREYPYNGKIDIEQHHDEVHLDIAADEKDWEEYLWTIDDTASANGKSIVWQFKDEGTHLACLTIKDSLYGCDAQLCANITYSLPRYPLGGQVFCGKYPAQSAESELYRQINGRWELVRTVLCADNAYFYFGNLPVGIYAVQAKLRTDDPQYARYAATYYGGALDIDNATNIKHYQNTWKTDISLVVTTEDDLLVSEDIVLYASEGILCLKSHFAVSYIEIFSPHGQLMMQKNTDIAKDIRLDINKLMGLHLVRIIGVDGSTVVRTVFF